MATLFILRPIATSLLTLAVVMLGLLGYRSLPIAALPTVDFPTIQVNTSYPGASADVVATSVTAPLEHYLGQITGLVAMNSTSSEGGSQIVLQFALDRPIGSAAQDVQEGINAASGWMPIDQLPGPPTYRLLNAAEAPALMLALTSDVLQPHVVSELAQTMIVPKLSQVLGVGGVAVEGGQNRAVRLSVNPTVLSGLGLSIEDVRRSVVAATTNLPKGNLDGAQQAFQVGANDQLFVGKEFRDVVIAFRNRAPVHLRDVGTTVDGVENNRATASFNGQPAIVLTVRRQPGANTLDVVDSVKDALKKLEPTLPATLKTVVIIDRTLSIRAAIADVQRTLLLTILLVVVVIFVFLQNPSATLIPGVVLLVSLISSFGVMAVLGFSLNNLSLMAMTIASGFIVDDAIVVVENVVRRLEAGETRLEAAIRGARQIGFTILSLTASMVAVFLPLMLMDGLIGRLFREFSLTLAVTVIISGVLSLTLTPMMCARLLSQRSGSHGGQALPLVRPLAAAVERLTDGYMAGIDWVLQHRAVTLLGTACTVVLTVLLYAAVPKGFLPEQDTGILIGTTDAPQDISFAAMSERQERVVEALRKDPNVVAVSSFVGAGTVNETLNSGHLYINIGPSDRRPPARIIMERLRQAAAVVPDMQLHLQPAQDLTVETRVARTQYQLVVQALDDADVRAWSERLLGALKVAPELSDVASDRQDEGLQVRLVIDRGLAGRYGVSADAIDQVLYDAFGQRQIAMVYGPLTQYRVVLGLEARFGSNPSMLDKVFVSTGTAQDATAAEAANGLASGYRQAGTLVPLSAFARFERSVGPLAVAHRGLLPAVTISFNVTPGWSLDAAVSALHRAETSLGLPDTVSTQLTGASAEFAASIQSGRWLILGAIVAVYVILGILYESFIHPLTILSTIPSAGIGAVLGLMLCGLDFDLIAVIGLILLIGIVKKNAIMMVDFALEAQRERGELPSAAIREACRLRFRPIMMTTFTALLGAVPLAVEGGIGSELRHPLGVAIVGGLIISQILTLYTTPVIFLAFDAVGGRLRRRVPTRMPVAAE